MGNLDLPFFAASLAFGWGLSLATYRVFAVRNDWPMGEIHRDKPLVPILLGVFSLAIAFLFAAFRAATEAVEFGGWWILPVGILWGALWTWFMRVGSQTSLFLAPLATFILITAWISAKPANEDFVVLSSHRLTSSDSRYVPLPVMRPDYPSFWSRYYANYETQTFGASRVTTPQ